MNERQPLWTNQFILITIINLLVFFGFQILTPTLPVYIKALGAADETIGWVTGIFTLSALLIRPIAGGALDKYGRKAIFLGGLVIFILATASYSFLPTVGLILLLRFIHGFGWGASSTASNTIASDTIPKARFGEGMAFFTLSSNLAMAIAPAVGLYIIVNHSFRLASLLAAILVVISFGLSFLIRYRSVEEIEQTNERIGLFEKTSLRPSIVIFFVTVTYGAVNSFLALYAMERGIENIGMFFTVTAGAMVVSRPGFGWLVDRKGITVAVIPGLLLVMASMYVLSIANNLQLFLLAALLYGVGFGAVQTSLQTMAVISAPRNRLGLANSTFYTGFDSGIGIGSIVLGLIAARYGYAQMFLWSSLSVVVALVLYLVTGRSSKTMEQGGNS